MAHALNGSLAFAVASPTPGRAGAGSTAVSSKGPLVPAAVAPLHKAQPTQPAHTPCLLTAANAWAGACEEAVDHAIATAIASVVTEISAAYYSLPSSERAAYKVAHSDTEAAVSQRLAPASSVSPLRGLMAMMEPSQEIDSFVSPFLIPEIEMAFRKSRKRRHFCLLLTLLLSRWNCWNCGSMEPRSPTLLLSAPTAGIRARFLLRRSRMHTLQVARKTMK